MNEIQKKTYFEYLENLTEGLKACWIADYLYMKGILTPNERNYFSSECIIKLKELLNLLPGRCSWEIFLEALNDCDQIFLSEKMSKSLDEKLIKI